MKYKFSRGITLIEILIAAALFGIFLSAVSLCVVQAYRVYTKGSKVSSLFRGASVAMEHMQRALHTCEKIYAPDNASDITALSGYTPKTGTPKVAFVYVRTNPVTFQKEVIAYQWRDPSMEIVQFLYNNNYDPADSSTQTVIPGSTKVLAPSVQDLNFNLQQTIDGEILTVKFTSYPDQNYFPILSIVQIKKSGL